MQTVGNKILEQIQQNGPGYVFTPKEFLELGSRQAIDTALSRLAAKGDIRRLARGLYDYPKKHRMLGDLLPSLDDIATAIARDTDSHIQVSGARAVYLLGLTTQVPAQAVYLTNGCSRDVRIGIVTLKLKHAGPKIMAGAGSKAGTILQAMRYLGKKHLTEEVINKLSCQLDHTDKQALKNLIRFVPHWTKLSIDRILSSQI